MNLPFTDQNPVVKLWAVATSMIVAILIICAGTSLLLADRLAEDFDVGAGPFAETFGLGTVALVWLIHIVTLIALLGFDDTPRRRVVSITLFLFCAIFLGWLIRGVGLPFTFNGMRSLI